MPSTTRIVKLLSKAGALLVVLAVISLAAVFVLIRREHSSPLTMPNPTGQFPVGRATYLWANTAPIDQPAPKPGVRREVMVWIWYPAAPRASDRPTPYVPPDWGAALSPAGVMGLVTRDLSLVRTHSFAHAAVAGKERSYPVVIIRAGGGAPTVDFTTLAEDLASHGYIVVGFDAPYRTYVFVEPDGRVIRRPAENDPEGMSSADADRLIRKLLPMWTADTQFVVDQLQRLNANDPQGIFTGKCDLERLGMFGHSFGGAQALEFCHDDSRCKAGIDIDGAPYGSVVQEGLKQPFMFVLSDHSRETVDAGSAQIEANLRSIYEKLPNGRALIVIRGANHFSFSDQILLKSQYVIGGFQKLGLFPLAPRRGLAITTAYLHTFFDIYLKQAEPVSALSQLAADYPEVQIQDP